MVTMSTETLLDSGTRNKSREN